MDDLVTDVARAKELLDYCGGKVQKADTQIRDVIKDLKPVDKAEMPEACFVPRSGAGYGSDYPGAEPDLAEPQAAPGEETIPF